MNTSALKGNKMNKKISPGRILIADPFLQDGEFTRSVILLTSYKKDNTMGFMINKPTDVHVHEVFSDFPTFNSRVYIGGPVDQNLLFFVHKMGNKIPNSIPITNNLSFGGEFEVMKKLIQKGEISTKDIRFFLGYSGWGQEQLQNEVKKKSWVVGNFKLSYLFSLRNSLIWPQSIAHNKPEYTVYSKYPFTPSLN